MFDLAICVALAWLTANIILIVDLRSLCCMLERERAERIEAQKQRRLEELARARVAYGRHAEIMAFLLANIVPARPVEDVPQTQREPAATRSQRPPAPALRFSNRALELNADPQHESTPARG